MGNLARKLRPMRSRAGLPTDRENATGSTGDSGAVAIAVHIATQHDLLVDLLSLPFTGGLLQ